jgi:RHS repeat-associated protein
VLDIISSKATLPITPYYMKACLLVSTLVISLVHFASASPLPAPLLEFKTPEQLKSIRSKSHSALSGEKQINANTVFYTGKPIENASGNYLFKNRAYSANVARWTSSDPSGFPDGANNTTYVNAPTHQVDYAGLFTLNVTSSATYSATSGSHTTTALSIASLTAPPPPG